MNLKRSPSAPAIRLDLLDSEMDSYVHWRDQSRVVAESYRTWHLASGSERRRAFTRYLAALDREERAAHVYRRVVEGARAV